MSSIFSFPSRPLSLMCTNLSREGGHGCSLATLTCRQRDCLIPALPDPNPIPVDSQGVGGQNLGSSLRQLEAALSLTCQQPGDEHPASPHVSQGCSGSHCQKLKDTKRVHRFCTSLRSLTRAVCCVYPSSSQPYEALPAVLRHACCSRHACTSMNPPDKSQFSPFSALTSPLRCPDGAEPNPTSRTPSPPTPAQP